MIYIIFYLYVYCIFSLGISLLRFFSISAVILFNSSSSIVADRKHIATFENEDDFYPSPSVFLYTLPNIVTGEIAIKRGYKGETSLYILNEYNEEIINSVVESTFALSSVKTMITGWVDCNSDNDYEAYIKLVTI